MSTVLPRINCDDGYFISTDRSKLDIPQIHQWLSNDTYWARGRLLDVVALSIANSLPFGVYFQQAEQSVPEQVGFARAVTDYCLDFTRPYLILGTFAWIADFYISRPHRNRGLSHFLLDAIDKALRSELRVKRVILVTSDADKLYKKHGFETFTELEGGQKWMMLPVL